MTEPATRLLEGLKSFDWKGLLGSGCKTPELVREVAVKIEDLMNLRVASVETNLRAELVRELK